MKKGKKMLLCGLAVTVLGVFIIPYFKIVPLFNAEYQEFTFTTPGIEKIEVKEPGKYYLWNDYKTFFNNRTYSNSKGLPNGTTVKIEDAVTGEELKFSPDSSISVTVGSKSQNSVGYVEIHSEKTLNVKVSSSEERVFTFAQSRFMDIFKTVIGTIFICGLLSVFGIFLIIYGAVRMSSRENKVSAPPVIS